MLASLRVPAECFGGEVRSKVYLNATARNASVGVRCLGASHDSAPARHGLDWQDQGGMGDTTGETILVLEAY